MARSNQSVQGNREQADQMIRVSAETAKAIARLKPYVEALIKAQQGIDVPLALGSVVKFAVAKVLHEILTEGPLAERK